MLISVMALDFVHSVPSSRVGGWGISQAASSPHQLLTRHWLALPVHSSAAVPSRSWGGLKRWNINLGHPGGKVACCLV